MDCNCQKLINKLLDGSIKEDKLSQLKEHVLKCKDCSEKLKQIELTDEIIKNHLLNVPYVSNKQNIMKKISIKKCHFQTLSVLYKSRKYICAVAAIVIFIVALQFYKPLLNSFRAEQRTNKPTVSTNIDTSSTITINTNIFTGIQTDTSNVNVKDFKLNLPSKWSYKTENNNSISFFENNKARGLLLIAQILPQNSLIENLSINTSNVLSQNDIKVPLGKGLLINIKLDKEKSFPYEMIAIIQIPDTNLGYYFAMRTQDCNETTRNAVMDIVKGISNPDIIQYDITKIKLKMPSTKWTYEFDKYNGITFYKNSENKGNFGIVTRDEGRPLIEGITPNHSHKLLEQNITTPLGTGIMAVFEVTSPAAAPVNKTIYEFGAVIPTPDGKHVYFLTMNMDDNSTETKNDFMSILYSISW